MSTKLRQMFETECRALKLPLPARFKLQRPAERSFGEYRPGRFIYLHYSNDAAGTLYANRCSVNTREKTDGAAIEELARDYAAALHRDAARRTEKARAAAFREEAAASVRATRLAALKKLGMEKLPSHVVIRNPSTGEELLRLAIERFDGERVGLYTQTDVNLAALRDDWGGTNLEVFLSLEGEQELR